MEKLHILVVDDKKIIGDLFDFTLGYSGHHIKCIYDPMEAMDALRKENFDMVFLDIIMPGKDGVQLLEEIKAVFPALPVVIMTGYSVEEKRNKAQELGAVTCLKKPFEMEDVRKVVKQALGKDI